MSANRRWTWRRVRPGARWWGRRHGTPEAQWFWDHYQWAAGEIVDFCESSDLRLGGLEIADVGCGDGIMALGLCNLVAPRKLVGFDVVGTNAESLLARAQAQHVAETLPSQLEFRSAGATSMPAGDGEFSFVYSWSAFEHIADPLGVLGEIRRILRSDGHFFLQLWPFYHSPKGSHLWDWFDDDFHHLIHDKDEIVSALGASGRHPEHWTRYMSHEFEQLNRITVLELQEAVTAAGFEVRRLELLPSPAILPPGLNRYSWTDLGIGGVKLLAAPI